MALVMLVYLQKRLKKIKVDVNQAYMKRDPTYCSIGDIYNELVHIYDQPQFHEHAEVHVQSHQLSQEPQPHEQPDGSCEQPPQSSADGDTPGPGCGQTHSLEQFSEQMERQSSSLDPSYGPPDRQSLNHDSHVDQQSPNQKPSETQSSSPVPPDDHEEAQSYDGYEQVQEYERLGGDEHCRIQDDYERYEKPDDYEKCQEYEKIQEYERVQEYERLGGDEHCQIQDDYECYEKPDDYEKCQEYEKIQDYEQIQEYERLGADDQCYKLDDYEEAQCYEIPDGYERVQEYERIGQCLDLTKPEQ